MKTVALLTLGLIAFSATPLLAQGSSKSAPGQQMQQTPQKEDKGASSVAPGRKMQQTPKKEPRGASSFAPGQTTGSGGKSKKTK
ncbi:hypothetical protein [Pseudorhodoplanes sinuspersici]|uniref:Uncharacterized protein n=1 Tax=Pseudorhodoplanes sinuspersici TaxID=1235591 RepID=A0A1W6ZTR8_9HYPH|nr:hypothetical protein [Pseudorhodoplanes sinuspersici]ARQ00742.1 hypothetical protein CAK95_17855 [Pseudorhodoplanes sinuspersici]RKE72351.1 hypothetical protein DFP91_0215 [Pseudorhodoplanes sinuspersici]